MFPVRSDGPIPCRSGPWHFVGYKLASRSRPMACRSGIVRRQLHVRNLGRRSLRRIATFRQNRILWVVHDAGRAHFRIGLEHSENQHVFRFDTKMDVFALAYGWPDDRRRKRVVIIRWQPGF